MQNTNNDLSYGIKSPSVGDTGGNVTDNTSGNTNTPTGNGNTDLPNSQQVPETIEPTSPEISPDNVVIKKDAPVTQGVVEEEEEKSSDELDTSTTKIEDREEDSESYMDDTVDY